MTYENLGCPDCGDEFHLDDCGGYNPPCPCGCGCCRSCHDANEREDSEWEYDAREDSIDDSEANSAGDFPRAAAPADEGPQ